MLQEFEKNGFVTAPFPKKLREEMLEHVQHYIFKLTEGRECSTISDEIWQQKMKRAFRMFPPACAKKAFAWAKEAIGVPFKSTSSAVNVVLPQEIEENSELTNESLAIYWRCVRPGKPDAGRPHRDASFWSLEFEEGYNTKIPFEFNYLKNCKKIWIPLSGCLPSTTLRVIPRSHKMDIPTIVEQTEYGRRPTICHKWLKEYQNQFMSPLELSQGHCIIFDMDLVHMGPRHNEPSLRISAEFNFISLP